MKTLQITIRDKLAVIRLDRGRANAIDNEMLKELIAAITDLEENQEVGGLIITGKEHFFSAGIDLMEVYGYDEQQSSDFWTNFLLMQLTLARFKKPFVTAITGHSPAGGCIVALCSDYRVMAKGDYIIGLNEIPVGIIVPNAVFKLYSFWLGKSKAYRYLLEGKLLKVDEALADGLIDCVAEPAEIFAVAEQKVRSYMLLNPAIWQQCKINFRKELLSDLQANKNAELDQMLKQWWSAETRIILQKMIDKLASPVKK